VRGLRCGLVPGGCTRHFPSGRVALARPARCALGSSFVLCGAHSPGMPVCLVWHAAQTGSLGVLVGGAAGQFRCVPLRCWLTRTAPAHRPVVCVPYPSPFFSRLTSLRHLASSTSCVCATPTSMASARYAAGWAGPAAPPHTHPHTPTLTSKPYHPLPCPSPCLRDPPHIHFRLVWLVVLSLVCSAGDVRVHRHYWHWASSGKPAVQEGRCGPEPAVSTRAPCTWAFVCVCMCICVRGFGVCVWGGGASAGRGTGPWLPCGP
jgi:hypothetical protein